MYTWCRLLLAFERECQGQNGWSWWLFANCCSLCTCQTHHCTKFCQNRSFRYGDIASFWNFKMATAVIFYFWNREILFDIGSRVARRISTPSFVKIGQLVAKILRFFNFSRYGSRPPSWICLGHDLTTHSEYLGVSITLQNLVMIDAVVFIIWTFQYFARLAG